MRKVVSVIATIILLLQTCFAFAEINNAGFEGGIHKNEKDYKKEKQYKEVIFLTGEPILLQGTVELKIRDEKLEYEYELSNSDGTVTLEREIELERIIDDYSHDTQIVETNNIVDYDEEITVDRGGAAGVYTLIDYQFHNSTIDDNQPVITYYLGNWLGTKTYRINENEGEVKVEITGNIYGYDHYWGATETQKIHKDIYYKSLGNDEPIEWYGYADIDVSFNRTKDMEYFKNLPFQTSFDGGYTLTEQEETIMKYKYNLPYIEGSEVMEYKNRGQGVERFETLPTQQKLYIPRFQDIKGHWAEGDIKRLAGLQVIDGTNKYFGPDMNMKRSDFAKWISLVMDLVEEDIHSRRSVVNEEAYPDIFSDVTKDNPDYKYIKAVKENNIMEGIGDNKFYPDGTLTRAQAITIIIRALGLERLAPNPPFKTRFKDDERIPLWARKAIYVADQIGIAKGTPEGYIYPKEYMTKAEASAFVNRFITYLQKDLKEDYRERIINFDTK
jgi:hypothetical protein